MTPPANNTKRRTKEEMTVPLPVAGGGFVPSMSYIQTRTESICNALNECNEFAAANHSSVWLHYMDSSHEINSHEINFL